MKVWLSNVWLKDAEKILRAFPGTSVKVPRGPKSLCRVGIASIWAPKELAEKIRKEPVS